ncbi:hypothetical protein CHARACLAT_029407 [Characodon lateralis]|uniref:Guanine nucleotide-binding protein subunit gamma n=2 Tax=Goodeidae TaxID=28758 RepID=A0ABU7DWU3_9TELE|nr:hypothetical protein [Characodon lateralis]
MSFLRTVAGHSLREGEELGHPGGARIRVAAPPHREEPVEVARASISYASWTPSSGGVPGTSHREEAQGTPQDTLEGLCLSAGLGMPWAPPGGAGRGVWGEGRLGVSVESAAPATRSRMKRKTTSTSTSTCREQRSFGKKPGHSFLVQHLLSISGVKLLASGERGEIFSFVLLLYNILSSDNITGNMTSNSNLSNMRRLVEQLKLEASVERIKVSQAAAELQQFCLQNAGKDALLVGVPTGSNPFREPRSCAVV